MKKERKGWTDGCRRRGWCEWWEKRRCLNKKQDWEREAEKK